MHSNSDPGFHLSYSETAIIHQIPRNELAFPESLMRVGLQLCVCVCVLIAVPLYVETPFLKVEDPELFSYALQTLTSSVICPHQQPYSVSSGKPARKYPDLLWLFFLNILLKVFTNSSAKPLDWGWHTSLHLCLIPLFSQNSLNSIITDWVPLSETSTSGFPTHTNICRNSLIAAALADHSVIITSCREDARKPWDSCLHDFCCWTFVMGARDSSRTHP